MAGLAGTSEDTPLEGEQYSRWPSKGQKQRRQQQQQEAGRGAGGDFAAQEAAMRATSASRWAEDEMFNLKNAFELQLKRLEVGAPKNQARQPEVSVSCV